MTYKDIKLASLQKMFNDVTTTDETLVTKPYLQKMAYVCNCAIQKIAAAGFAKRKFKDIILTVPVNRLGDSKENYELTRITEDTDCVAPSGKSYYFELCGKATVKIYVGDSLVKTIENIDENVFTKHKGILSNDSDKPVKLSFLGGNAYLRKNTAVYDEVYENADDVYEISEMKFYDMETVADDFYKFDSQTSVICNADGNGYGFFGEKTFCVNGLKSGQWRVPYMAYPQIITDQTPDTQIIELPDEAAGLIPYYIASELYLEDDSGLCVGWRNKFEAELYEYALSRRSVPKNRMKFVNLAGDDFETIQL